MFSINPEMGDITTAREFDINAAPEYTLQVKASNPGTHPTSSSIPVHIMVTMADNASPR
jgi:protocadherin Fat 1/2/3